MSIPSLANLEYPGRFVCLGRDRSGEYNVIVYGLTGRSPSSRARKLCETEEGTIHTEVTDPAILAKGNPKLLLYSCIRREHQQWFVGNGSQTDLLVDTAQRDHAVDKHSSPLDLLVAAFSQPNLVEGNTPDSTIDLTTFEPDAPTHTPRISAILDSTGAAMCIVKNTNGLPSRHYFSIPLHAGKGYLLSTYTGQNVLSGEIIPSFVGEPFSLDIPGENPQDIAEAFYDALGPKTERPGIISPGADFRVGVAALLIHRTEHRVTSCLINRIDRSVVA